jgi:hypothetical protein
MNPGSPVSASSHGMVHITADNGYILYVNGERIGAGGQSLGKAVGQAGFRDWTHTDAWTFLDSCVSAGHTIDLLVRLGVPAENITMTFAGLAGHTHDVRHPLSR